MTLEDFKASLAQDTPPQGVSTEVVALWVDVREGWEASHEIVQELSTPEASWVHAYLHRREGDSGNAAYWYRRAGRPVSEAALEAEWDEIASALLNASTTAT